MTSVIYADVMNTAHTPRSTVLPVTRTGLLIPVDVNTTEALAVVVVVESKLNFQFH
jgi:hypothetical protein